MTKTLAAAELSSSVWSDETGKLKLTFKRPSQALAALELTETIEVLAFVAADKPGGSDRLHAMVSKPGHHDRR